MPDVMLYAPKADRGMLRCRLCGGRLIPLGVVARHAERHIADGEAVLSGSPRCFGHAQRWALTPAGAARLTEDVTHG